MQDHPGDAPYAVDAIRRQICVLGVADHFVVAAQIDGQRVVDLLGRAVEGVPSILRQSHF